MKSMGDPDYVYRPLSDDRKALLRELHLRRLGTPPGYRLVYNVPVPEAIAPVVQDFARRYRNVRRGNAVKTPLWQVRAMILIAMKFLLADPKEWKRICTRL